MNLIAQILALLGILTNIVGIQLKKKNNILIAFMLANFLFALCFALLNAYSGALICMIAAIQTLVKYYFDKKDKVFPKYLTATYIVISIISGLLTYKTVIDILPVICSILYTMSIIQEKESTLRFITLFNVILWTIYDFAVGAYTAGINDIFLTSSTLIAIYRYDIIDKIKLKKLLKKLETFTIESNIGFLTTEIEDLGYAKFVYSETIEDSIWNFITNLNFKNKKDFELKWEKLRKIMIDKNRKPTLYVLPTHNKKHFPKYMQIESNEIWLVLDDFTNIDNIKDAKIEVSIDSNPKVIDFANAFMDCYNEKSSTDPYGEIPEYYKTAIINSKENTNYKRTLYIAYYKEEAIATALTIEKDDIALIGFVGTIPKYRRKGVCNKLMKKVLKDLNNKQIKYAYLQTEKGYIPESLYKKIGFKEVGTAIILVEQD
ncbi:MAG: GNAT family N-acetyltransferase [Bacilli bacterium]|nr:GNAT family N-acetyltransferase [Bacilli bacterium]